MIKALIVEDEAKPKVALLRILGRHGWWVDAVESVEEALNQLRDAPPHVVVIDRAIDQGSGLSLLLAIRSHPHWQRIPVVLTCNQATLLDVAEALESGAADFLRQPFNALDTIGRLTPLAQRCAHAYGSVHFRGAYTLPVKPRHQSDETQSDPDYDT